MKSLSDCYSLNNGVRIPCIGFGTWQALEGEVAVSSVKAAIAAGYRHIDTAAFYGNEESVGRALRESGVDRKELFITTKLWNTDHGYEPALRAFETSMKKLGLDYLDLYLIHWPNPKPFRDHWEEVNAETWRAFEELYENEKIRAIGISNFRAHHIDALLKSARVKPMVNQIRLCPGADQEATVEYSRKHNMLLEAYSPLGVGQVLAAPEMQDLAQKYRRSVAQVCIRWSLQQGYLPLPKSANPERIEENLRVFDFELSPEDMAVIAALKGIGGAAKDPDATDF
jgi:diketogulonate reductase-like aldo/keto reductase